MFHCRHCKTKLTRKHGAGRGVCHTCYYKPGVLEKYACGKRGPKPVTADAYEEPTTRQVEKIVAEQIECLPGWWADDCGYERPIYTLVKCT